MREPNVIGDWQEYDGDLAGLRVRVHGVECAEPPRGRDDAAEGLTYFRFRVSVENRGAEHVDPPPGGRPARHPHPAPTARAPSSTGATPGSSRASTSAPCVAPPPCCTRPPPKARLAQFDVQVQLRVDEMGQAVFWSGGIGVDEASSSRRAATGREGIAGQISAFLHEEAERGAAGSATRRDPPGRDPGSGSPGLGPSPGPGGGAVAPAQHQPLQPAARPGSAAITTYTVTANGRVHQARHAAVADLQRPAQLLLGGRAEDDADDRGQHGQSVAPHHRARSDR